MNTKKLTVNGAFSIGDEQVAEDLICYEVQDPKISTDPRKSLLTQLARFKPAYCTCPAFQREQTLCKHLRFVDALDRRRRRLSALPRHH